MANVNAPFGARPLYHQSGAPIVTELFSKAATYGTALYPGDFVAQVADNTLEVPATPGTTLITGVNLGYGAASTLTEHPIIVDPFVIFAVQSDGSLVEADMGLNANLVYTAGDATKKLSKHQIDSTTEATTASLDVKLIRKVDSPDNAYGNYVVLEVLINKHRRAHAVAGV
jgi:hypothetical protein